MAVGAAEEDMAGVQNGDTEASAAVLSVDSVSEVLQVAEAGIAGAAGDVGDALLEHRTEVLHLYHSSGPVTVDSAVLASLLLKMGGRNDGVDQTTETARSELSVPDEEREKYWDMGCCCMLGEAVGFGLGVLSVEEALGGVWVLKAASGTEMVTAVRSGQTTAAETQGRMAGRNPGKARSKDHVARHSEQAVGFGWIGKASGVVPGFAKSMFGH